MFGVEAGRSVWSGEVPLGCLRVGCWGRYAKSGGWMRCNAQWDASLPRQGTPVATEGREIRHGAGAAPGAGTNRADGKDDEFRRRKKKRYS